MGDENTLWNSKIWGGIVVILAGFLFAMFMDYVDYALYDVMGINLWAILGAATMDLIEEGIPAILMGIGFVSLIWGFYQASK